MGDVVGIIRSNNRHDLEEKEDMKKLISLVTVLMFSVLLCGSVRAGDDDSKLIKAPPTPVSSTASTSATSSTGNVANTAQNDGNNNGNVFDVYAKTPHQAPFVFAPDAGSTATCRVGGSAGGSFPFGGLVLSLSRKDTECDIRQAAKSFDAIGDRAAAHDLLCSLKVAKNLDSCKKDQ
ncbi:MAG: hypothetical protein JWQ87_2044 [Candidatus Sulfotelmatobacter sp.]|nr:hypothetical protein [Candidatus Sulfotelmatobacter sp.]